VSFSVLLPKKVQSDVLLAEFSGNVLPIRLRSHFIVVDDG